MTPLSQVVSALPGLAGPSEPSGDHAAMAAVWQRVDDIMGGQDAIRAAGARHLPRLPGESDSDYQFRLSVSKFTNIYKDIVVSLAAKPFSREAFIRQGTASQRLEELAENIDGQGTHVSVFAAVALVHAINYGVHWILVDHTADVPARASVAEEREMGARPYFVHVVAPRLLAIYSEHHRGEEVFVHARISENATVRDGWRERTVRRVRVFDREVERDAVGEVISVGPPRWSLLEWSDATNHWEMVAEGDVTLGVIPLVPVVTGLRQGDSWRVVPPLQDAANLQIVLYQQESDLEYAKKMTAFPMLTAEGVPPATFPDGSPKPVPVGPRAVLYAPPTPNGHGTWRYVEPAATSLAFLAAEIRETKQDMRELGRQPLTAQTGNLTVVTTAFAAQKGNSVVQLWAFNLRDACENALWLAERWLGNADAEPEFDVFTDFEVELRGEEDVPALQKMREDGDLSAETYWNEMQRRGVLGDEFDAEEEAERLLGEMGGDGENDESAVTPPPGGQEGPSDDGGSEEQ